MVGLDADDFDSDGEYDYGGSKDEKQQRPPRYQPAAPARV